MQILIVLMFVAYFAGGFQLFAVSTYGVTSLDLLLLIFYIVFFSKALWHNFEFKIPIGALTVSMALFLTSIIVSSVFLIFELPALEILQFFKTFSHLIFLMLFAFICLSYEFKASLVDNLIKTWLILSLIINIFGIYQIFARGFNLPLAWLDFNNITMTMRGTADSEEAIQQLSLQFGNFFRATSIFSEPSALATFNLYIIVFTVIPYIQRTKQFFKSNILNISIFLLAIMGLFLTFSLTGVLGIGLILISVFILENSRTKKRITEIFIIIIVFLIPSDLIIEKYTETSVIDLFTKRIVGIVNMNNKMAEGTDGESFTSRLSTMEKSIEIWEESPIVGIGLGLTQYNKKVEMQYSDFSIMTALCELGAFGALAFTAIFASIFYIGYKGIKLIKDNIITDDRIKRQTGLLFYLALIQLEINFFTGNNLIVPNLWIPIIFILIPSYSLMLKHLGNKFIKFQLLNQSIKSRWFSKIS